MKLIIGGAYQGKLEYVKQEFSIEDKDIFRCDEMGEASLDFSKKVIYGVEQFTLNCVNSGIEAADYFRSHEAELEDKILIVTDISQGIVPIDKTMRAWREMNGRAMLYLSGYSEQVIRIFCGLPQILKEVKVKHDTLQTSLIHLIRHGTTEGNVKRWYYGRADIPLLDEGRELLKNLREQKIYPNIPEEADFYTSGLLRTEQTFQIIFGDREHKVLTEFEEMSFGDFEKKTYEDLKDVEEYQSWISNTSGEAAPPNGESPLQFRERVNGGFQRLLGLHKLKEFSGRHSGKEAHSAVVCHGGVISAIMMEHFPQQGKNFYTWIPDPGHGYTIELKEGRPEAYTGF